MSRFHDLSLSVVMPAYNETEALESTIRRSVESLRRMVGRFEILLMDDCSTDGTPALADELAREIPELRVLHNETNLRQGGCLRLGFGLARFDLVTHNAIDYPFDFDDLPVLLEHFPEADLVVGTRRSYPGVSARRRFVSFVNWFLLRILFGAGPRDYNFVQVYRRELLRSLRIRSRATAFITPEIIIRAQRAGYRVVAVEVNYHRRETGVATSATLTNIWESLRDMLRLWVELRRNPRRGALRPTPGAREARS